MNTSDVIIIKSLFMLAISLMEYPIVGQFNKILLIFYTYYILVPTHFQFFQLLQKYNRW